MPKYYQNLTHSQLHHAEFTQLLAHTLEDFKAANLKARDEDFTTLLNTIKTKLPTMQAALEQVRASEKSQAIQELDKARDRAFRSLVDSIKPYRYATAAADKNAYHALTLLFKQYKGAAQANFEEETALINTLLTKLKSDTYQDDVTALGIAKFVTALTTAQTTFETQFNARSKETLAKTTYDVKTLRRELTEDYTLLIDYIGINAKVKSDTFYKNALGIVNNSRKYFADLLARRANEKEQKDTPPTTEE